MKKQYNRPEVLVTKIRRHDVIATSLNICNTVTNDISGDAPGRRMDDWYEGY